MLSINCGHSLVCVNLFIFFSEWIAFKKANQFDLDRRLSFSMSFARLFRSWFGCITGWHSCTPRDVPTATFGTQGQRGFCLGCRWCLLSVVVERRRTWLEPLCGHVKKKYIYIYIDSVYITYREPVSII